VHAALWPIDLARRESGHVIVCDLSFAVIGQKGNLFEATTKVSVLLELFAFAPQCQAALPGVIVSSENLR
jgi:hypothetical protein